MVNFDFNSIQAPPAPQQKSSPGPQFDFSTISTPGKASSNPVKASSSAPQFDLKTLSPPGSFIDADKQSYKSGVQAVKDLTSSDYYNKRPTDNPTQDNLRQKHQQGKAGIKDYVGAFMEGGMSSPIGKLMQASGAIPGAAEIGTANNKYVVPYVAKKTGASPEEIQLAEMALPFVPKVGKAAMDLGKPIEIASPAVKTAKGKIVTGENHDAIGLDGERGFTTNKGQFVDRKKALDIAQKRNQVKGEVPEEGLHSENLIMPEKKVSAPKAAASGIKELVNPVNTPEARTMAENIRRNEGEARGAATRQEYNIEHYIKPSNNLAKQYLAGNKQPTLDFLNYVETRSQGTKLADLSLQKMADDTRKTNESLRQQMASLNDGEKMGFYQDYFPRMFKNPEQAQQFTANFVAKQGSNRAFQGRTGKYPTIEDAVKSGLELQDPNIVNTLSKNIHSTMNYVASKKIVEEMQGKGIAKWGTSPPQEGWVPLEGRFAKKPAKYVIPGEADEMGVKAKPVMLPDQKLYAPEQMAKIYNNHYSKGFEDNKYVKPVYEVYREASALNTAFELSLSGTHYLNLGAQSFFTDISRVLKNTAVGDIKGVGKGVKSLVANRIPFMKGGNFDIGGKMLKQYKGAKDYGLDMQSMVEHFEKSGLRTKQDPLYRGENKGLIESAKRGQLKQALNEIRSKGVPKGAIDLAGRVVNDVSYPLFEYYVPRVKAGAFGNLMGDWIRQHPGASEEEIGLNRNRIADLIDDRFGEMNLDNLFWAKKQKQIAGMALRAQGWDIGGVRQAGGGMLDTVRLAKKVMKGKKIDKNLLDRPIYMVAAAGGTMMLGSLYQYLMTGKPAQDTQDAFMPQTGGTSTFGSGRYARTLPERVQVPGHAKDVYRFLSNPGAEIGNKFASFPKDIIGAINNKDYRGDPIGDESKGFWPSVPARAGYVAGGFTPFSLSSQGQARKGSDIPTWQRRGFGTAPVGMEFTDPQGYEAMMRAVASKEWQEKLKHDKNNRNKMAE